MGEAKDEWRAQPSASGDRSVILRKCDIVCIERVGGEERFLWARKGGVWDEGELEQL